MDPVFIRRSALKHEITPQQMRQVLAYAQTTQFFSIHDDVEGDPQEMAVGFAESDVLLEIGITYGEDIDYIFHAKRAGALYRKLFERRRK